MNPDVKAYFDDLRGERKARLSALNDAFVKAVPEARVTMLYRMPTFERDADWVSCASQKQYIAVYFCGQDVLSTLKERHPELDYGKGCVRIRDSIELPLEALVAAFERALHSK